MSVNENIKWGSVVAISFIGTIFAYIFLILAFEILAGVMGYGNGISIGNIAFILLGCISWILLPSVVAFGGLKYFEDSIISNQARHRRSQVYGVAISIPIFLNILVASGMEKYPQLKDARFWKSLIKNEKFHIE